MAADLPKKQKEEKKKEEPKKPEPKKPEPKKPAAGSELLSDLTDGLKQRVNETKLEMKVKDNVQLGIEA